MRATVLGLTLVFAALSVSAQDDWQTSYDEGGVLVETRSVAGSDYKAFRARTTLAAPVEDVVARLRDIDRYPEWFPDTLEARSLTASENTWSNYVRTDAPWPVKDRDAVYVNRLVADPEVIRIEISADPDAVAESRDAVRVRKAGGFWELRGAANSTNVHWEFHLEPGGNVPGNLANARVVETPKKALQALQAYFASP